ncbi:MAG: hypothetical protein QXL17_03260 [Candidatus Thermoplasmatota archaeon]
MVKTGYERYGLSGNPFRDLSSESLENVDIFHVTQRIDEDLARIREEVFYKENKAVLAVLGGLGAGKTERLLLVANEAKRNKAFYVFQNMTFETRWMVEGILDLIISQTKLGFFSRVFAPPKWYKAVVKKRKKAEKQYDPDKAGRVIAEALNQNIPSFLLINDFHHLAQVEDADRFLHVLHVLIDHINPGVMIMISCDQMFFESLMESHQSLHERINRKIVLSPLSDQEAQLMIAKRLLEKRLVDDVDPLYPFTPGGIAFMNLEVAGNPRHLLKLADVVIDYAAKKRCIMIDDVLVSEVLTMIKEQKLAVPEDQQTEMVCIPLKKEIPLRKPDKKEQPQHTVSRFSLKKDQTTKKKLLKKKNRSSGESKFLVDPAVQTTMPKEEGSDTIDKTMVKISCPMCHKTFTSELNGKNGVLRCPYCDFIGSVTE